MDRNHCPRSIGIPVRNHRNPHDVQATKDQLYKNWGITELQKPSRTTHFNAIHPWFVTRDGTIHDTMFS